MNELELSYKFEPLFNLFDKDFHPEVDTVIITGGRYSLKSYTVSIFSLAGLYNYGWNTLYTRYTNLSIVDSIKPELSDKIDLLGLNGKVLDTNTQIEYGKNRISFKGIKTGSKGQTANLKSLSGFNLFVNDEAEELPDFKTFKKIFYSIRSTDKRNLTILILNPTTKDHWIFQEFFEKKGLEGGDNCIVDNVLYIHSSYLDCDFKQMPTNILNDYLRLKKDDPNEYDNIVLGGWITEPEGVLLPKSKLSFMDLSLFPEESIIYKLGMGDPADKGGDRFSMPFIYVVEIEGKIKCLVKDVIHTTAGIEATAPRIIDKTHTLKIDNIIIESNGVGLAALLSVKPILLDNQKLIPWNSHIQKETRILSHYEFVRDFFIFDINYESNPEYKLYMQHLCGYQTEGDNKHKIDAIDSACLAANIVKNKFYKQIYK